ncbi:DNA repair protein endonuclease SAE2/CtIP C-terminus-domain-containing protein [Hypoxylon argillaceum]|nr:DNA repair protein endonuclease SAE2/CtIP C-terminus-domain-containing protein [Hypoxylon argillaceum]
MENWFEDVGRTVLLEALGDACDQINTSFKTDFQAYAQEKLSLTTELATLRDKAARVRQLEDENIALRDEINVLKAANREQTHAPDAANHAEAKSTLRTPLAPRSSNQVSLKGSSQISIEGLNLAELKTEVLRVNKKHAKLHDKYLDLQDALRQSNQLLRDRTATSHQWVDHAKKLGEQSQRRALKIKKLEAKLAEIGQEPLNSSFSSDTGDVEVASEPMILSPIHFSSRQRSNAPIPTSAMIAQYGPKAPDHIDNGQRAKPPLVARSPSNSNRSALALDMNDIQGTSDAASCLPPLPANHHSMERELHIKSEPSSDTPVVVSERPVRKRKHASRDEGDINTSLKLKIEYSPESQSNDERRRFSPQESIDFYTEYHRVETPRKHTRYQHAQSAQPSEVDVEGHDPITSTMHPTNTSRQHIQEPAKDVSMTNLAALHDPEPQTNANSALQSLNNNQVLRARPNLASSRRNRKSSSMPRGIASLAEDGHQNENFDLTNSKDRSRASVLEHLLNSSSPMLEGETRQSSSSVEVRQSSNPYFQLPKKRELPFGKDGRKSGSATPKGNPSLSSHQPAYVSTNQGHDKAKSMHGFEEKGKTSAPRLRQMPKEKLQLDDFKINPHANEGYDYAFSDVVRKKDDRACLQGCVKENCCGSKFRALAHAHRASTRPCEFRSLLESYLGDDCHRLAIMPEAEKETLWIEAKTRELANTNGKHRHRYPRMSTPPGFWRADFPSTQEGEEYNEEAVKLEREIIEERYREAMRPGGLWVFRDE